MSRPSLCSNWAAQIWWAAATLRLNYYCLVRGHLLATSAWTFSRSYYRQLLCVWATAWYVAIYFLPQRGDVLSQLLDQLLYVWATAWYVATCLLPARGRSLAAIIRQLLACRVPELSIIPDVTSPDWKQKKSIIIPASTAVLPRTFVKALGATFVWLDACVSTAENTVLCTYSSRHHPVLGKGTDFSSIIKWSQNFLVKFPLVSRKFWASKFPRLGEFEPKFPGEEIFPENFLLRNGLNGF